MYIDLDIIGQIGVLIVILIVLILYRSFMKSCIIINFKIHKP